MSVDTASCTLKETCIVMSFEGCSVASLKDTVIILSENKFVRTLELKDCSNEYQLFFSEYEVTGDEEYLE